MSDWTLLRGDCRDVLPTLPAASVDAVVSDPPYPEIDRDYGRMSESDWHAMMRAVVAECRRVLKPRGSAVFVLQPNSERVGRMRMWLWDFMAWAGREWGIVQDAWWWNPAAMPHGHGIRRDIGLMRPSVKACVWLGDADCCRDQDAVLWSPSDAVKALDRAARSHRYSPSGAHVQHGRIGRTVDERGGCTPFNLLPIPNTNSTTSGGASGHGAATPLTLCEWWVRYLCPAGGVVFDPFGGSGTVGAAALRQGRCAILVEKHAPYWPIAEATMGAAAQQTTLALGAAP